MVMQVEGCFEAGALPAEQPQRLVIASLTPAGADAQAEQQGQPGHPLPWWQEVCCLATTASWCCVMFHWLCMLSGLHNM